MNRRTDGERHHLDSESSDGEPRSKIQCGYEVTICTEVEANAILFIFDIYQVQKILFNIKPTDRSDSILKSNCIKEVLSSSPGNGKIVEVVDLTDGFQVYMWKFEKQISCSSVTEDHFDFVAVHKPLGNLIDEDPRSKGIISYPFFTLNTANTNEPSSEDSYPSVHEAKRVNALSLSLQKKGYLVHMGSAAGSFYCPFSGGGDIYIENGTSDCLVFMGDAEDTTDAEGSNDVHEVTKVSPTKPGTQKLSSFSVEAKRDRIDLEKLKYQLFANMTMVCIKNFVDCCLQQKYSKTGLISVKLLTAYGALLCGDGGLAGYKLEIQFGQHGCVLPRVKPNHYNPIKAAKLMDCFIEKFMDKTDQWK